MLSSVQVFSNGRLFSAAVQNFLDTQLKTCFLLQIRIQSSLYMCNCKSSQLLLSVPQNPYRIPICSSFPCSYTVLNWLLPHDLQLPILGELPAKTESSHSLLWLDITYWVAQHLGDHLSQKPLLHLRYQSVSFQFSLLSSHHSKVLSHNLKTECKPHLLWLKKLEALGC